MPLRVLLLFLSAIVLLERPCASADTRPNVLFIAVDDLRPELGCYGQSHIHSPHIDSLAENGLTFQRAYCQQAVCNPSRTSLMTGMRPDSIGVTGNHSHFRTGHPNVVTLPQHFLNHGYHAAAIGKIYHGVFPDGSSQTTWDTMGDPQSWSEPAVRFGPRYYYTESGIAAARRVYEQMYRPVNPAADDWMQKLVFGPATESPDVPDSTLYDGMVANAAIDRLRRFEGSDTPFFLAVGFIKPHSPYIAPRKYFDLYENVGVAALPALPADAPSFAGHGSGELRRYTDQPKRGPFSLKNQQRIRQGYFACISYVDAQIGRVLQQLRRSNFEDNTIVVLYGDHGYHLGEQGLWGKTTNFELDTRVPLIVRAPGMKAAGRSSSSLVELLDVYPTLVELAGLPGLEQLQGRSFAKLLDDPRQPARKAALSQHPRGGGLMGYSMRTPTHRLTQWIDRRTGKIRATELYDYEKEQDLVETRNVAAEQPAVVRSLASLVRTEFPGTAIATSESTPQESSPDDAVKTSFEAARPGSFESLTTPVGTWAPTAGRTIIDDKHASTGRQCLQLTGGKDTSVVLQLAAEADSTGDLVFRAERWTKRQPFAFRIEKHVGGRWQEIYNGGQQVRVGRPFLSQIHVHLGDAAIRRLRFRVTSPPDTGILIDDVCVLPARPQKVRSAAVIPMTLPALVGTDLSPLLKLNVETTGRLNPVALTGMTATLTGRDVRSAVASVHICSTGPDGEFSGKRQLRPRTLQWKEDDRVSFSFVPGEYPLAEGANHYWIAVRLNADADIDYMISATCRDVTLSTGEKISVAGERSTQRLGVAVRQSGEDGVHTYRIPGLVTTNAGTLIGVYDVRRRGGGDLPGDIDVGMSRSTDGGRTWDPMSVIMDMGDDPRWRYDGVGDPAVLVDRTTGTIWVAGTWSHGNRSWRGSGPGLKPEDTGQLMLVRSDDDGVTWSDPINITSQVKRPEWCFLLQGPGKGITMADGTIVFAAQYQDPPEKNRLPHSTILYSKDHGVSWHSGTGAFDDTTESQVIEVRPGELMLNCRYNRKPARVVMTTRDMGATWQKHATSERSLIEPGSCMASLIDIRREAPDAAGDWLLFSNPDSTRGRHHMTIKASPDRGLTWPKEHRLLLDEGNSAGYSCLSMIDQDTVGILYEGSQAHMTFQRIPLRDVIGPAVAVSPVQPRAADLSVAPVFGDHMVLQADAPLPVWGRALPEASVTVRLGDDVCATTADRRGAWQVRFKPRPASSQPTTMHVATGARSVTYQDVLIGEVWVCAGQSNMEWPLSQSQHGPQELQRLDGRPPSEPPLRLLHIKSAARGSGGSYKPDQLASLTPDAFCSGRWQTANPDAAKSFSAVAWFFGRQLRRELNVPVGLICPAVGGTPTEAWVPRSALREHPHLKALVAGNWLDNPRLGDFCRTRGEQNLLAGIQAGEHVPGDDLGPNHSFKPGFMWSAAMEPLVPYAIRGAIWYQGESNAESLAQIRDHDRLFPLLVKQWRQHWKQGDFPFLFVQLPAMDRPEWPRFRESQRRMRHRLENVGMVVTIDTGLKNNVHPPRKRPVGDRLAAWALGATYDSPRHKPYSGPMLQTATPAGAALLLTFDFAGTGLRTVDQQSPRHFEVCGSDGVFYPAAAEIREPDKVVVSSARVTQPVHARYAWQAFPEPPVNLVNSAGLPASPFSTQSEDAIYATAGSTNPAGQQSRTKQNSRARPNILLIVGEDHGCELSCYGDPVIRTPHIDQLAAGGVLFENAYVTQSVCSPSRSSIFTGLYPHQNGQLGLATHQYSWFRSWPTSYSLLQAAGYRTGLIGKTHVNPADAVESFVDFRFQKSSNFSKKGVAEYAVQAGRFFRAGDEPFFMTVNYPDAHWPLQGRVDGLPASQVTPEQVRVMGYVGHETERLREVVRRYYDCMLRLDACVGQLLGELERSGKADNTLVVFIGDHGAQMARGKVTVYEGGVRVPYLVRWPGVTAASVRSQALVSTIDLLPTFLDAAGATTPGGLPGRSLRSVFASAGTQPFREYLVCERNCDAARHTFPQRTIRDARYKLIHSPVRDREDPAARYYREHGASHWAGCPTDAELSSAPESIRKGYARWLNPPELQLYDLKVDPHEWQDLAGKPEHMATQNRLLAALRAWQSETRDPLSDAKRLRQLMDENDRVFQSGRRSPVDGWKYLEYLNPDTLAARNRPASKGAADLARP